MRPKWIFLHQQHRGTHLGASGVSFIYRLWLNCRHDLQASLKGQKCEVWPSGRALKCGPKTEQRSGMVASDEDTPGDKQGFAMAGRMPL